MLTLILFIFSTSSAFAEIRSNFSSSFYFFRIIFCETFEFGSFGVFFFDFFGYTVFPVAKFVIGSVNCLSEKPGSIVLTVFLDHESDR